MRTSTPATGQAAALAAAGRSVAAPSVASLVAASAVSSAASSAAAVSASSTAAASASSAVAASASVLASARLSLHGRHALVTGGGRGIGAAIARRLLADGASVTLLGRDAATLDATLTALRPGLAQGATLFAVSADITDATSVGNALARAGDAGGPVTLLVNNAGQAHSAPFGKTDLALWQRMLDVNLTGTFLCTQAALPAMLAAGWGRVVNVASTAGLVGYGYVSAYCAAKHGVIGLTRALALELAAKGITVNAVCPGYTETDIVRDAVANIVAKTGRTEVEARAELSARNPQRRLVQPEEVADAVAWLCQPSAAAINGQAIPVAGGEVMAG